MKVVVCLLLGAVMGLVGGMVSTYVVGLGSVTIPVGAIAVLVALIPMVRGAAWWQGRRWGGAAFAVGWLAATFALGTTTGSGDLVITGGPRQMTYLLLCAGLLAAGATLPLLDRTETRALATVHSPDPPSPDPPSPDPLSSGPHTPAPPSSGPHGSGPHSSGPHSPDPHRPAPPSSGHE